MNRDSCNTTVYASDHQCIDDFFMHFNKASLCTLVLFQTCVQFIAAYYTDEMVL
jgi:hypothetical protein